MKGAFDPAPEWIGCLNARLTLMAVPPGSSLAQTRHPPNPIDPPSPPPSALAKVGGTSKSRVGGWRDRRRDGAERAWFVAQPLPPRAEIPTAPAPKHTAHASKVTCGRKKQVAPEAKATRGPAESRVAFEKNAPPSRNSHCGAKKSDLPPPKSHRTGTKTSWRAAESNLPVSKTDRRKIKSDQQNPERTRLTRSDQVISANLINHPSSAQRS